MTASVRAYLGDDVIDALRRPVLDEARGLPRYIPTNNSW